MIILVDIRKVETIRLSKIYLVGSQGKFATNGTIYLNIYFWSIECCFIFYFDIINTHLIQYLLHHILCFNPEFWHVYVFFPQLFWVVLGEAHHVAVDTELLKMLQIHRIHLLKFLFKLRFSTVNMRIVHLKTANSH